jgi:hypothetical protein
MCNENEIYAKLTAMIPFQAEWAIEYERNKRKYIYDKGRREKQRVKERKLTLQAS